MGADGARDVGVGMWVGGSGEEEGGGGGGEAGGEEAERHEVGEGDEKTRRGMPHRMYGCWSRLMVVAVVVVLVVVVEREEGKSVVEQGVFLCLCFGVCE